MRKIIHIDMDAFYASVEQRDNPQLKGKPVAVGGSRKRGVVAAASYEARKFGVFSAMPSITAYRKCPQIIFVKPRFEVYREVSQQIREIFHEYTDLVEPLSLDEAYLDVTSNKKEMPSATLIAKEIKKKIKEKTHLNASAGISMNKFLAKIASDLDKPDGLALIHPTKAEKFVEDLSIEKFHGIGKVTAKKMKSMGIYLGKDLKDLSKTELMQHFGKVGSYYYNIARAIDERAVNPNRIRKSISTENTFSEDLITETEMMDALGKIAENLHSTIEKKRILGKTLTLKIKFANFKQITRSKTIQNPIIHLSDMMEMIKQLLPAFDEEPEAPRVRLLGVGISNFEHNDSKEGIQLTIEF